MHGGCREVDNNEICVARVVANNFVKLDGRVHAHQAILSTALTRLFTVHDSDTSLLVPTNDVLYNFKTNR